jgi:hypothetical protein
MIRPKLQMFSADLSQEKRLVAIRKLFAVIGDVRGLRCAIRVSLLLQNASGQWPETLKLSNKGNNGGTCQNNSTSVERALQPMLLRMRVLFPLARVRIGSPTCPQ